VKDLPAQSFSHGCKTPIWLMAEDTSRCFIGTDWNLFLTAHSLVPEESQIDLVAIPPTQTYDGMYARMQ
jgi:hypothetical protein